MSYGDKEEYITKEIDRKRTSKNLKSLDSSIPFANVLRTFTILLYPDYHCHNPQIYF